MEDEGGLLDLLDSTEKPFEKEDKAEESSAPKKEWNNDYKKKWEPRGDWKPKGNGYNYGPKQPFVNLFSKKDFTPKKIEVKDIKHTQSFIIVTPNGAEIGEDVKKLLVNLAIKLGSLGYTYRSNGDVKDMVQKAVGRKFLELREDNENKGYTVEHYLPWPKFNEDIVKPKMGRPNETAYSIALNLHNSFYEQKDGLRAILSRDVNICLGESGTDAVKFMLIYTPCGSESIGMKPDYRKLGSTSFYLKIAAAANIPVFNVKNPESIKRLSDLLKADQLKEELSGDDETSE